MYQSPQPLRLPRRQASTASSRQSPRPSAAKSVNGYKRAESSPIWSDREWDDGQSVLTQRSSIRSYRPSSICSGYESIYSIDGAQHYGHKHGHDKAHVTFEIPKITRTPWEVNRRRTSSARSRQRAHPRSTFPSRIFENLPREVYDGIIEQLGMLHLEQEQPCPSCHLRDLHSLSLTSHAWDRAATVAMYCRINLPGDHDTPNLRKLDMMGLHRLKLLRRTLRHNPSLADLVCEIHLPEYQTLYHNASIERDHIANSVASLVMACPNLERLVGFHIPYTQSFDRLSHALSTRTELKERMWFISPKEPDTEEEESVATPIIYHAACDPTERLLELNSHFNDLNTLILHQESDMSVDLNFRAIIGTMRQNPSLRHLSLSGLSARSFTNMTLNALPFNLRSLRLENITGINDNGLQRFFSSIKARYLQSVSLVDLEISNLTTISVVLSGHLPHLQQLTLAQDEAPDLPPGTAVPELYSHTLEYIHWELRSQAEPLPKHESSPSKAGSARLHPSSDSVSHCLATLLLASGISNGFFPSLDTIRIPHDPQGILQGLCKPLASALLPNDPTLPVSSSDPSTPTSPVLSAVSQPHTMNRSSLDNTSYSIATSSMFDAESYAGSYAASTLSSPATSIFSSHICDKDQEHGQPLTDACSIIPSLATLTPCRTRQLAHHRILAARRASYTTAGILDEDGSLRTDNLFSGFVGDVESKITYELRPDRIPVSNHGGDDEREHELHHCGVAGSMWITHLSDVMGVCDDVGQSAVGRSDHCRHAVYGRAGNQNATVHDLF